MELLHAVHTAIAKQVAERIFDYDTSNVIVPVIRRCKHLRSGDFAIPLAAVASLGRPRRVADSEAADCDHNQSDSQQEIVSKLLSLEWTSIQPVGIVRAAVFEHDVRLHLDRDAVFRAVCMSLEEEDGDLIRSNQGGRGEMVVNVCWSHSIEAGMNLETLRTVIVAQHMAALAHTNGYDVSVIHAALDEEQNRFFDSIGLHIHGDLGVLDRGEQRPVFKLLEETPYSQACSDTGAVTILETDRLNQDSKHIPAPDQCVRQLSLDSTSVHASSRPESHVSRTSEEAKPAAVIVDLGRFVRDRFQYGHTQTYSPNLGQVTVYAGDVRVRGVEQLQRHNWSSVRPVLCCHVMPRRLEFMQQQVDLLWQLTAHDANQAAVPPNTAASHTLQVPGVAKSHSTTHVTQVHLPHGLVHVIDGPPHMAASEYVSQRREAVCQSFISKYGEPPSGCLWEGMVDALTLAAIRFEILSTSCTSTLKVKRCSADCHQGIFVMYNCARLAKIFQKFEDGVSQGQYTPLPSAGTIAFSLLDEEEWLLVFKHIVPYSSVVRACLSDLQQESRKPLIHTHKICTFLYDLCRDLSSYYAHTHVLSEPLDHLLPVMYARLWVLKAVERVFHHALSLLQIQPVRQI